MKCSFQFGHFFFGQNFDLLWLCTSNTPRLLSMLEMVISCAKYIHRFCFDVDWMLFVKWFRISLSRNPDRNFFNSTVGVKVMYHCNDRDSKGPLDCITFSDHNGSLETQNKSNIRFIQLPFGVHTESVSIFQPERCRTNRLHLLTNVFCSLNVSRRIQWVFDCLQIFACMRSYLHISSSNNRSDRTVSPQLECNRQWAE